MKDLFKDPDLWRQKRGELPVDSEAQTGWQEMQSILDKHLPVLPLTSAPHVSKAAKIIKALKAIKATSVLIASLTVATVAGTAIYLVKTDQHKNKTHRQPKKHRNVIGNDSLNANITVDSLNQNTNVDSLQTLNELIPSANKTDSIYNTIGADPANSSNVKMGGSPSKNQQTIINGQIGNSQNVITSSIAPPNHNIGNYATQGTHHGKGRQMSAGNLSTHQGTGSGANATTANALPDIFTQNDIAKNNHDLILSANTNSVAQLSGTNGNSFIQPQIFNNQPVSKFVIANSYYNKQDITVKSRNTGGKNKATKNSPVNSGKTKRPKTSSGRPLSSIFANVDWGVLIGANSSGSFTPGTQNKNIYGSFPVDIYPGIFGTYHLNNKWAINAQVRLLTPLNLSGSYTNENSGVDSAKLVKVTDSRKAYFVSIPLHVVYKIGNNVSIKGGPVINILAKQVNGNTNVQRLTDNIDTIFLANTQNKIKTTRYDQKINLGLSGGVSVQYNRLIFEALYQKNLSGYQVKSDFGNYKNSPGTLQISVGFKLNSSKHH